MDKIKHAFDWYYNAMSASKAERLGPAHAVWNGFAAGYAAAEQAQQAESLTWKPGHRPPSVFKTSEAGRQYVADYFAKALRRHDFSSYIKGHLAADFACALSDGLHAMQQAQPPAVAATVPDEMESVHDTPFMSADTEPEIAYRDGWNACRAAMLAAAQKGGAA